MFAARGEGEGEDSKLLGCATKGESRTQQIVGFVGEPLSETSVPVGSHLQGGLARL